MNLDEGENDVMNWDATSSLYLFLPRRRGAIILPGMVFRRESAFVRAGDVHMKRAALREARPSHAARNSWLYRGANGHVHLRNDFEETKQWATSVC